MSPVPTYRIWENYEFLDSETVEKAVVELKLSGINILNLTDPSKLSYHSVLTDTISQSGLTSITLPFQFLRFFSG